MKYSLERTKTVRW